jgi:4-amino-4-deoxy-L-arabinose transferase-like glycosyltransferase
MHWLSLPISIRRLFDSTEGRRRLLIVGLPLALATAFKLWLALTTIGTNDVRYWNTFMDYIVAHGSVTIYRDIWYYNHPPLMSGLLRVLSPLVPHAPNGFPFLIRLPAIVADVVSTIVVFRLIRHAWDERRALICAAGVALSPILVMVSGFHGNSDPVFMCLVLLAADRLLIGKSPIVAGLCLGLAVNVKLVPLIVVPVFFFHPRTIADKARFGLALIAVVAAGYGYHVWMAYPFMKKNVFEYGGLRGIWGLGELCGSGLPDMTSLKTASRLKQAIGLAIMVRAIALAWLRRSSDDVTRARSLLGSIGWAFLIFMLLTPGFGIQYLAWLAIASFLLGPAGGIVYNLLGGAFMFSVYHYWNRGFPWHFADSDKVGAWRAPQALLGRIAWIYLVVLAALLIREAWARRRHDH